MSADVSLPATAPTVERLRFVWLEITGLCQLECAHCYASSGPSGGHGAMRTEDWRRVIDEAAGLGVEMVQFIGGEPTLHPALPELLSDQACEHEQITGRQGSHARTRANIAEAIRRSIPLRVGVIDVADEQRSESAAAELRALGVTKIGVDRLREVGRGVRGGEASIEQLCGRCGDAVLAVSPGGDVWPCVFSRWLPVGNVRERSLGDVLESDTALGVTAELLARLPDGRRPVSPRAIRHAIPVPASRRARPGAARPAIPIVCDPRACWPSFSRATGSVRTAA